MKEIMDKSVVKFDEINSNYLDKNELLVLCRTTKEGEHDSMAVLAQSLSGPPLGEREWVWVDIPAFFTWGFGTRKNIMKTFTSPSNAICYIRNETSESMQRGMRFYLIKPEEVYDTLELFDIPIRYRSII